MKNTKRAQGTETTKNRIINNIDWLLLISFYSRPVFCSVANQYEEKSKDVVIHADAKKGDQQSVPFFRSRAKSICKYKRASRGDREPSRIPCKKTLSLFKECIVHYLRKKKNVPCTCWKCLALPSKNTISHYLRFSLHIKENAARRPLQNKIYSVKDMYSYTRVMPATWKPAVTTALTTF